MRVQSHPGVPLDNVLRHEVPDAFDHAPEIVVVVLQLEVGAAVCCFIAHALPGAVPCLLGLSVDVCFALKVVVEIRRRRRSALWCSHRKPRLARQPFDVLFKARFPLERTQPWRSRPRSSVRRARGISKQVCSNALGKGPQLVRFDVHAQRFEHALISSIGSES
jgi:hypothetical protein